MKTHDFENKLRSQQLRRVPAEWREEILAAAIPQTHETAVPEAVPFWQWIFGRFPVATTAFAGFWIAVIGINYFLFVGAGSAVAPKMMVSKNDPSAIWRLQSGDLQQLASRDSSISADAAEPMPAKSRGPRSDLQRRDEGIGENIRSGSNGNFA